MTSHMQTFLPSWESDLILKNMTPEFLGRNGTQEQLHEEFKRYCKSHKCLIFAYPEHKVLFIVSPFGSYSAELHIIADTGNLIGGHNRLLRDLRSRTGIKVLSMKTSNGRLGRVAQKLGWKLVGKRPGGDMYEFDGRRSWGISFKE